MRATVSPMSSTEALDAPAEEAAATDVPRPPERFLRLAARLQDNADGRAILRALDANDAPDVAEGTARPPERFLRIAARLPDTPDGRAILRTGAFGVTAEGVADCGTVLLSDDADDDENDWVPPSYAALESAPRRPPAPAPRSARREVTLSSCCDNVEIAALQVLPKEYEAVVSA